ncbi:MAG: serine/threonine-protein kinase [Anaerolineales bacterium]|nr:serine/threonine-protein kinase [Anaerolineales bacterium]
MSTETIGRYQLKEEIGRSKTTVVYRAFDTQANRDVVVKIFAFEPTGNATLDLSIKAHFRRELKMIASLEHAAIVPVYDVGEHNGQPYFVMRYMAGGSLTQAVANNGKLPLAEAANIVDRIASALAYAHEKNIIHRDVKPDNILFDGENHPYISDFGVAQPAISDDASMVEGEVGTPGYMSPEQANREDVDNRSDVYSLGVVLYQMLTGKKLSQPTPDILSEAPELPPEMDEIIKICLAENKRDRYVSILHLSRALKKVAFGEQHPSTFFDRYGNWAAIRTSLFWITLSVVALVGFFWMFTNGSNIPFLSVASTPTIDLSSPSTIISPTETFTAVSPTIALTPEAPVTVQPTPTFTVPGGADQVALVSGNDIYLMNIDGTGVVQIRSENSPKSNLQWIPGNRLVYISRNCAYLVDAATKQTQQLSCFDTKSELLEGFSVSPDGKLVAISVQRTLNIFPFDVDVLRSIKSRFELVDKKENCFYNQVPFREALWSKDETRLAAHVIETRMVNSDQIFLLNADIANCDNVELGRVDTIPGGRIDFENDSTGHIGSFDWNGKSLFLLNDAIRNDGFGNLYLYNSETREVQKINPINGGCCYRDPRWSPDGTYIMFAYQRFDRSDITLYYIPFADIQNGGPFTPIQLPNGFFSTSREKPQPALRPIP